MTEIPDVVRQLQRGWKRLATGLVLGLLVSLLVPLLTDTTYKATSYLVVSPVGEASTADAANYGKVFARVATDPVVLAASPHLDSIGLTPFDAAEVSTVTASPDAPVLAVEGSGGTAFRAAEVANFVAQGMALYADAHADDTGFVLRQLVRAAPPQAPAAPRPLLSLVVGVALGLALGTVAALAKRPSGPTVPGRLSVAAEAEPEPDERPLRRARP